MSMMNSGCQQCHRERRRGGGRSALPGGTDQSLTPTYASRFMNDLGAVPRNRIPETGMPPATAAQIIRDDLSLDSNAGLNLASFVSTHMEPEACALMADQMRVNAIDTLEYPATAELQRRCIRILADLFHSPPHTAVGEPEASRDDSEAAVGEACVGSSEGCLLGGFAMKLRHRAQQLAERRATCRPNLVLSSAAHVVWKKFCVLADVEARYVPLRAGPPGQIPSCYVMEPAAAMARVDENTIGIVALFGSTLTGEYDDVAALASALRELNKRTGRDVGIHVDAASGGFIAPFAQPHIRWDFALPEVHSINTSGSKYGLVFPGMGFVLWRSQAHLPAEMHFRLNYLGASGQETVGLNFSRSAAPLVGQYYNFLRLGRAGYAAISTALLSRAAHLRRELVATGAFESVGSAEGVPVVCVRLKPAAPVAVAAVAATRTEKAASGRDGNGTAAVTVVDCINSAPSCSAAAAATADAVTQTEESSTGGALQFTVYDVAEHLRGHGWVVPAYSLAPDAGAVSVLRIVVREGLSADMGEKLLADMRAVVSRLQRQPPGAAAGACGGCQQCAKAAGLDAASRVAHVLC